MKLKISHLFFILLAVLVLSNLGFTIKEGLSDGIKVTTNGGEIPMIDEEEEEEDKYILKSSIIPPICPKCPDVKACPRSKPCPPCPACARCPESAFTCKKVPDYNAIDTQQIPKPVLNDFSKF